MSDLHGAEPTVAMIRRRPEPPRQPASCHPLTATQEVGEEVVPGVP